MRPLVGINYFAGWWKGAGDKWYEPWNASVDWRPLYKERVPLLGAYNSQETMDREIVAASSHGVDFFQILWYDDLPKPRAPGAENLNRGLKEFMASPESHRMNFTIEVCNAHPRFNITSDAEWATLVRTVFVPAMSHPSYLRTIDGDLVFKFISGGGLKTGSCNKSTDCVHARIEHLRAAVRAAGLGEMIVGAGMGQKDTTGVAWWGGHDTFNWTGVYAGVANDTAALKGHVLPWKVESDFTRYWRFQHLKANQSAGFLPVVMSGWDPRPWREARASYVFPTEQEWVNELEMVKSDLASYPFGFPLRDGSNQPAFNIYAWNEFGEGGFMAPTEGWQYSRLEAIQKVFPK